MRGHQKDNRPQPVFCALSGTRYVPFLGSFRRFPPMVLSHHSVYPLCGQSVNQAGTCPGTYPSRRDRIGRLPARTCAYSISWPNNQGCSETLVAAAPAITPSSALKCHRNPVICLLDNASHSSRPHHRLISLMCQVCVLVVSVLSCASIVCCAMCSVLRAPASMLPLRPQL